MAVYSEEILVQTLSVESLVRMTDLPFVSPLHQGMQPILRVSQLPTALRESYDVVTLVFSPSAGENTSIDSFLGGNFRDLVERDFESLRPIIRKVQEIRVLDAYLSDSSEYSWLKIVLFSEPETLNLVVYLEKEENQWKITGIDTISSNQEDS